MQAEAFAEAEPDVEAEAGFVAACASVPHELSATAFPTRREAPQWCHARETRC